MASVCALTFVLMLLGCLWCCRRGGGSEALNAIDPQLNCHQMLSVAYRFKHVIQIANCRKRAFDKVPHFLDINTNMLDLKSNRIKRLFDESFYNYPNLIVLFLDGNEIAEIARNAFAPLSKLEVLTLRDNFITLAAPLVPSAAFVPLSNLRTLNLDNNPLGKIPDYFFAPLRCLRHLYLNGSGALDLGAKSLAQMHNLTTLDLSACKLSTLSHETEKSFNNMTLSRLHLADNPWLCDCRIKWLVRWFKMQPKATETNYAGGLAVDQPMCAGPTDTGQLHKSMLDVQIFGKATEMRNFACAPKPYRTLITSQHHPQTNKELWVYKEDNVTLTCEFESDPKGHTEWFKDDIKVLPHWQRFTYNQTGGRIFKTAIYIRNVELTDAANYRCTHQNIRGKSEQIQRLRIRAKNYNFETMKVVIIILSIATLIIVMLTTLTVFIYCFYCRAYGRSFGRRGVKQVRRVHQRATTSDKELAVALNPTKNFKNAKCDAVNFVNATHESIENLSTSIFNNEQAHLVCKHVLLTSSNGDITCSAAPISAQLQLNGASSSTPCSPTTQFNVSSNLSQEATDMPAHDRQQGYSPTIVQQTTCPVHGSRLMNNSCPVHGSSRSGTPQEHQCAAMTNNKYGTLPSQASSKQQTDHSIVEYQPCPLHGDWLRYASLPTTKHSAQNLRNKPNLVTSSVHTQQHHHHHHHHQKQSVSFAEPEHLEQAPCSPTSSIGTTASLNPHIRLSKIDNAIIRKESAAAATLSNVSNTSCIIEKAAVGAHILPAKLVDDEGYSTAV